MRPAILFKGAVLGFLLITGCYKDHLYVQQEWVDRNFLASTRVGTPDPRQQCPPQGQRLLIAWSFPSDLWSQQLQLVLTVRFWDNVEEVIYRSIHRRRGNAAFNFFDRRILTYRIQIVNQEGIVVETWEHQFWTELIDIDRRRLSVSSQSKQGSVIETP